MRYFLVAAVMLTAATPALAGEASLARNLYALHCAGCHGTGRLGGMGTALLPENLHRLPRSKAAGVIAHGEPITQMPAFGGRLSKQEIQSLVD